MKLLLTSSGLCNESLQEALRQMVGRPTSECNFVFIVTSYNGAAGDMTWLVNDIYNAHHMGWKDFRILDIAVKADWDKKLWWQDIEQADVILVGGGNAGYISYWMQKAGLFDVLPELLKTKVYVGISAGSMAMTAGLNMASPAIADESFELPATGHNVPDEQTSPKALGITNFLFRPHWYSPKYSNLNEDLMRKAYAKLQKPIYLVDDQTGIKIEDNKPPEVISEGEWRLIDESNAVTPAGQSWREDLNQLHKKAASHLHKHNIKPVTDQALDRATNDTTAAKRYQGEE